MKIQNNISLKDKNWFQTGGPARYFCEPKSVSEFQKAVAFAREKNMEIFVLGSGANILISDEGFPGLVIRPALQEIKICRTKTAVTVRAGAGVLFPDLINFCLKKNYLGLEEFSGIPGSVGGSVYINIHYVNFLLSNFLTSARVLEVATGEVQTVDNSWFNFAYDYSKLQEKEFFLIDAEFSLKKGKPAAIAYARGRHDEMIRQRKMRYPESHTCGSFFRNFHSHEVTLTVNNQPMIFAAYYFDKLGIKGELRVGNAIVSHKHANMLFNLGNATSADLASLARKMQELVHQKFCITPQPECQLVGFKLYPLA